MVSTQAARNIEATKLLKKEAKGWWRRFVEAKESLHVAREIIAGMSEKGCWTKPKTSDLVSSLPNKSPLVAVETFVVIGAELEKVANVVNRRRFGSAAKKLSARLVDNVCCLHMSTVTTNETHRRVASVETMI